MKRRAWIPLVAIPALTIAVCSGIGTLLAGPEIGTAIVVMLFVVLIGFCVNIFVSWLLLRNSKRNEN